MPLQTQALWFPPDSNSQGLRQEEEPVIGPRVHVLLETNHHSSFPKANHAGLDLVRWSNYCFITGKFISMTNGELLHGPATHHELLTQHQSQENKVIWLFMHSDKLQKRHMNNMQCCHIKYLNIYSNRRAEPNNQSEIRTRTALRLVFCRNKQQQKWAKKLSYWRRKHMQKYMKYVVGILRAANWLEIRSNESKWRAESECWVQETRAALVIHVSLCNSFVVFLTFFCCTYNNLFCTSWPQTAPLCPLHIASCVA